MNENVLARRYAKALAKVAADRDIVPTVQMQLAELAKALQDDEQMRRSFADRSVADSLKLQAAEAFIEAHEVRPELAEFIRTVARRNRMVLIGRIAEAFRKIALRLMNTVAVTATSARELRPEEEGVLRQTLERKTGKNIILHAAIDPSILGGGVIRIGCRLVDGSVKTRLDMLREKLISGETKI